MLAQRLCGSMGENQEVAALISQFQTHFVQLLHILITTPVDLNSDKLHISALQAAFLAIHPEQSQDPPPVDVQLRSLGFVSEDGAIMLQPFHQTGLLGLDLLNAQLNSPKDDANRVGVFV